MNGLCRAEKALRHEKTDRTPLFEIFQPCHPIFWDIAGRNIATDMAMMWDAMADGVEWNELLAASIKAQYQIAKFFALDMVRLNGIPSRNYTKPRKIGKNKWFLNDRIYCLNDKTKLVELENPCDMDSSSNKQDEDKTIQQIEEWDGKAECNMDGSVLLLEGVMELARKDGLDLLFMGEVGAGTGVAFYPPFMLMWMLTEEELFSKWLAMRKAGAFYVTRKLIETGCKVIAMGGDVSSDRGPVISPDLYRKFILPVIQEHVNIIHDAGAYAVYTSDGYHGPIIKEMFFDSGVDGYKEVDKAAGMTWEKLIETGISEKVCIVGNIDARHTLCLAGCEDVKKEVIESLTYGLKAKGGHILHASHSVHEDVKTENYYAVVQAYREFFGMEKLAAPLYI